MNKTIISIIKYIFIFILFFACLQFFYASFRGDYLYNYGFSYAISRGEIPYRDFNMIIPPLGAWFYSLFFILFGTNNIVFNITQALLITCMFYFLFKLLDKKTYLFIPILCMFYPITFCVIIFPGYNYLLLFELILLIYLEKKNSSDYLIGVLVALSLLTKQTTGFCLFLVSLYYLVKDKKKVLKRLIGFSIPCFIFLLYLLFTNTFTSFLDLCFLGMIDFADSNGKLLDFNTILFLLGNIYLIYRIIKNKKDIRNYYILAFSTISIPLFDYYHVILFLFSLLIIIIDDINIKYNTKTLVFNSIIVTASFILIWFGFNYKFNLYLTNYNRFYLFLMDEERDKKDKSLNNYIKNNKDKNLIVLISSAYFFKITNNMNIDYYDLLNYGNHGYHGTEKMIEKLSKEKAPYFIINIKEYNYNGSDRQQINKKIIKYVLDNYQEKERIGEYIILGE